ncbi:MAG: ribosome small subunit-dependent GTPase A [Tepidisphaeraceae bacterium]
MSNLAALGWCAELEIQLNGHERCGHVPGRVVESQRNLSLVATESAELWAAPAGRLRHESEDSTDLPAIGDWVVLRGQPSSDHGVIERILDRRSVFSRKAPGGGEQVVAANVDLALVVNAMGANHNLRRIERYLALAWESGSVPLVLLTKADLAHDIQAVSGEVSAIAPGVDVLPVCALDGTGLDELRRRIRFGRTAVLLGSSGAGKSTLVNALLGQQVQAVSDVGAVKDRGRHTTTSRKLLTLPTGGMIIDTPGMREIGLTDAESGVSRTFEDIERLTMRCKFTDCAHDTEPGCAVRAALADGSLDRERYRSYQKLQREAAYEARQNDSHLMRHEKERWKKIHVVARNRPPKWMR